ncbi:MAG: RNA polymerase sigma factor [Pseudomonadota bacterium]
MRTSSSAAAYSDALVEKAQAGDAGAFKQIYQKYHGMVARLAYNITGNQQDLEDIIQETFLQVHRSLKSFHGDSKFSTWLYRLAINVSMQYVRQHKKTAKVTYPTDDFGRYADDAPSPEDDMHRAEKRKIIMDALEKLSEKKRMVFILHELHGVEAGEIARILKIPTLTVRTRLFYARKAIYRILVKEPSLTGNLNGAEG